jgi:hypothetical protein
MVNEDAALLNRPATHMNPAALFDRRLHTPPIMIIYCQIALKKILRSLVPDGHGILRRI